MNAHWSRKGRALFARERRGEDEGLYDVVKQDPEPPWTETDRPGPDMGRPAGWHPAGVHTAKHGQVTLHGTLHVSCEIGGKVDAVLWILTDMPLELKRSLNDKNDK